MFVIEDTRRVWIGPRDHIHIVRVCVHACGAVADRVWDAVDEVVQNTPLFAEDRDAGPHTVAFLSETTQKLADKIRSALVAVSEDAGMSPEDIASVAEAPVDCEPGIHRWGDGQGGTVWLAVGQLLALIVEDTQRFRE